MPTNRRFARVLATAGLLLAVTLSSGCGFFCLADWQCPTGCCIRFQCINDCLLELAPKVQIDDAAPANDFTDLLVALFPPAELAKYWPIRAPVSLVVCIEFVVGWYSPSQAGM